MKNIIQSVRGTREFYPRDLALRNWLYTMIRKISESYGYQEYDGPFLETLDLYAAKSGEELVKEQSFVFPDRGGEMITLRPELTLSLARMIAQRQSQLVFPLRWWSFGPFWRYEKPQKGRTREFFQWNIDLVGVDSPEADAEIISLGCLILRESGLNSEQARLLINDRELMISELKKLALNEEQQKHAFKIIDRQEKMSDADWEAFVLEHGWKPAQLHGLKEILQDDNLWEKSKNLKRIFQLLEAYGLDSFVAFDARIVRGLDYYTGIVFEARDTAGRNRAIFGGGHYDNLVADVGGTPLPGVGFAMGDVVFPLVLEEHRLLPSVEARIPDVLITNFGEASTFFSLKVATQLRKDGFCVEVYPDAAKLAKQFKYADRAQIRFVVTAGPDEISKNMIQIKDLKNGNQEALELEKLTSRLGELTR